MKDYRNLVAKTKMAMVERGVPVDVFVERDEETGRYYLCGRYDQRLKFPGATELFRNTTTLTEEIYRGNEKLAYDWFTMHFSPNRVAHMKATDE